VRERNELDLELRRGLTVRGRVVDTLGKPVEAALVARLFSKSPTADAGPQAGRTTTAADGRFELGGLDPYHAHTLALLAPGFGRTLYDVGIPEVVDLGDLVIAPPAAIFGRVTDADGRPWERIEVALDGGNDDQEGETSGAASDRSGGLHERRFTDDLGRFRFPGIAPGTYQLRVRSAEGRWIDHPVGRIEAGDEFRTEIVVDRGREFVVLLRDDAGEPVAGAYVLLEVKNASHLKRETDASGRAVFELTRDPQRVHVRAIEQLVGRTFVQPEPVVVETGKTEVIVTLRSAIVTSGRVLDPSGEPVHLAVVFARVGDAVVDKAWTDETGAFSLKTPERGPVALTLEGRDQMMEGLGSPADRPIYTGRADDVTPGAADVVLRAVPLARDGSLTVMVVDPDGAPFANVNVHVNLARGENVSDRVTDADGRAAFTGLPRAELRVGTLHFEAPPPHEWIEPEPVTLSPEGQTVTLVYRKSEPISGIVVDADGNPAAGARVTGSYGETEHSATTDAQGRFRMPVAVDAAEVRVHAYRSNRRQFTSDTKTCTPGQSDVKLVLPQR
jgi:protocatechuate 3,4-dioxygenase beta subunit